LLWHILLQCGDLLGTHIGHLMLKAHARHAILLGEHLLLLLLSLQQGLLLGIPVLIKIYRLGWGWWEVIALGEVLGI
jgi:hypothetical protein